MSQRYVSLPSRPIRHIVDGGGNLGLFSLVATAAHLKPADVLVIKPDLANVGLLRRNFAAVPNAVVCAALASTDGECEFSKSASNAACLAGRQRGFSLHRSCPVRTHRLPHLIPSHWNLSETWLKIDIEGAEYEVLRDMLASGVKTRY